jgi:16S rRNA G1207 methylase RsmC
VRGASWRRGAVYRARNINSNSTNPAHVRINIVEIDEARRISQRFEMIVKNPPGRASVKRWDWES